jgi:hypothetical protein
MEHLHGNGALRGTWEGKAVADVEDINVPSQPAEFFYDAPIVTIASCRGIKVPRDGERDIAPEGYFLFSLHGVYSSAAKGRHRCLTHNG